MECTSCKFKKQIALKRCKHFELGGEKKQSVSLTIVVKRPLLLQLTSAHLITTFSRFSLLELRSTMVNCLLMRGSFSSLSSSLLLSGSSDHCRRRRSFHGRRLPIPIEQRKELFNLINQIIIEHINNPQLPNLFQSLLVHSGHLYRWSFKVIVVATADHC